MKRFLKKLWVNARLFFNPANVKIAGQCKRCGTCCRNLILADGENLIQSEKEFEQLEKRFPDIYRMFEPKTRNSDGDLLFACTKLNPDNTCSIYKNRPPICAAYPTRTMFKRHGALYKNCGFYTAPVVSFQEILDSFP